MREEADVCPITNGENDALFNDPHRPLAGLPLKKAKLDSRLQISGRTEGGGVSDDFCRARRAQIGHLFVPDNG